MSTIVNDLSESFSRDIKAGGGNPNPFYDIDNPQSWKIEEFHDAFLRALTEQGVPVSRSIQSNSRDGVPATNMCATGSAYYGDAQGKFVAQVDFILRRKTLDDDKDFGDYRFERATVRAINCDPGQLEKAVEALQRPEIPKCMLEIFRQCSLFP